jgi:hypothetical protein
LDVSKVNIDVEVSKNGKRGVVAAIWQDGLGAFLGSSILVVHGITDTTTL